MFPLFFSVSASDVAFAEEVWKRFPEDWVYLYSKTGEEGAHIWNEISRRELPASKLLVVFWSSHYANAEGCIREIAQARELVNSGRLRPIILRLDDFPIVWTAALGDSIKPVFETLRVMLDYRTSSANLSTQQAIDLIQRVAESTLGPDHPQLSRDELQTTLRGVVRKDRFNYYPAVWVSGFNGAGRETLVKEFSRNFAPNGRGVVIEVNEASLPRQIRLRIETEALGADRERISTLNALPTNVDEIAAVADAIERAVTAGNYVIFRHSRIVEENVELPEWIDEVVNCLSSGKRPKLFIISQIPLLGDRRARCRDSLVTQRVPSIDEHKLVDFSYQLVAYFDKNPERWGESEIIRIARASGGNIGFLVLLTRMACRIEDFDEIDKLIAIEKSNMSASITMYLRWAFQNLRDFDIEQRALLFLNDISPCDIVDLEKVLGSSRPILRVVGKLLDLGLIEREDERLYRLNPLLATRLSRELIRPDLLRWQRNALVEFVGKPLEIDENSHIYLRIESRIQASILSGEEELPKSIVDFASAAHWLQAGIRLYHERRREPAYRILKKAYSKRAEFAAASRIELTRYFCLSATQNRKYRESEQCIQILEQVYETKGMAAFLRADLLEHQRKFVEAIYEYERSIELNRGKNSRLERTYRPLIRCVLSSPRPDFALAKKYAEEWLDLRVTVFSLMALARVYLHWMHRGLSNQRGVPAATARLYREALFNLENHPGVGSAHFELKAEEATFSHDFSGALEYMDKAIEADPRFELRAERWRLMAKSGVKDIAVLALNELEAARYNNEFHHNWVPFLPMLAETYAIALNFVGRPIAELNSFAPELQVDEIGAIINRVRPSARSR